MVDDRPPHEMRLSIRKNRKLVVWCTCQADTNHQRHRPHMPIPRGFWAWDWLAIIDITESPIPIFREHVKATSNG